MLLGSVLPLSSGASALVTHVLALFSNMPKLGPSLEWDSSKLLISALSEVLTDWTLGFQTQTQTTSYYYLLPVTTTYYYYYGYLL